MNEPIGLYVTAVVLGTVLTVSVGVLLYRSGEPFLAEVFGDRERATGTNRLLVVLFHLIVLGILALISVVEVPWADGAMQILLTKLGVVLLVLGVAHGMTMLVFLRIRTRRRLLKPLPGATALQPAGQTPEQAGGPPQDVTPGR